MIFRWRKDNASFFTGKVSAYPRDVFLPLRRPSEPLVRPFLPLRRPSEPLTTPFLPLARPSEPLVRPFLPLRRRSEPLARPFLPLRRRLEPLRPFFAPFWHEKVPRKWQRRTVCHPSPLRPLGLGRKSIRWVPLSKTHSTCFTLSQNPKDHDQSPP